MISKLFKEGDLLIWNYNEKATEYWIVVGEQGDKVMLCGVFLFKFKSDYSLRREFVEDRIKDGKFVVIS
jgi:hypothetical protein